MSQLDYRKQLSQKQQATIIALADGSKTTAQICELVGVGKGAGSMMTSMERQGLVVYRGGPGTKPGKGKWLLTSRGNEAAISLIDPATPK